MVVSTDWLDPHWRQNLLNGLIVAAVLAAVGALGVYVKRRLTVVNSVVWTAWRRLLLLPRSISIGALIAAIVVAAVGIGLWVKRPKRISPPKPPGIVSIESTPVLNLAVTLATSHAEGFRLLNSAREARPEEFENAVTKWINDVYTLLWNAGRFGDAQLFMSNAGLPPYVKPKSVPQRNKNAHYAIWCRLYRLDGILARIQDEMFRAQEEDRRRIERLREEEMSRRESERPKQ